MTDLRQLAAYSDDRGNRVEYDGPPRADNVLIRFTGQNNRMIVASDAKLGRLSVMFDCDNGELSLGGNTGAPAFSAGIRIGQDSTVSIGKNVSTTATCTISATEGTTVSIGDDVMFASENQVRADDGHAIYDVRSGNRVNVSKSIRIGNHVWLAWGATILGGVSVGDGTVLSYGAIVTKNIPNNCIAAGVPARVVRRNIAWERAHLSLSKPYYKPNASVIKKSQYWHDTVELAATGVAPVVTPVSDRSLASRIASRIRRTLARGPKS